MNTLDPATVDALREIATVLRDTAKAITTLVAFERERAEDAPDGVFEELQRGIEIMRASAKHLEHEAQELEILE